MSGALTKGEVELIDKHIDLLKEYAAQDLENLNYYQATHRIESLGIAVPPQFSEFMLFAGWCRTYIDLLRARQNLREVTLEGQLAADDTIRSIWVGSRFKAQAEHYTRDSRLFGRGFLSVWNSDATQKIPRILLTR